MQATYRLCAILNQLCSYIYFDLSIEGMTLYDISMLNLVEVMKRENPSISLRSIINSIDAASNIKVSHCRTLFPCYNTT